MSNDNNNAKLQASENQSDVERAANEVNPHEVEKNLQSDETKNKASEQPENLSGEEKTPFIDEKLRTDK
ncbi:hypothetical protein [Psychrobacter sanguinis]|uniref:hypothetical protein n=1 Tax=Psychrobacter sanguinis TaxID=861445 RepID=UPI002A758B02|nr:hypothetical protein [Psychrobacter sanguinis]MDY3306840.1 hypothetical protein [Psychrobacter sanguinis]